MPKNPRITVQPHRRRSLRTIIIQAGTVAAAIISITAAWHLMGGDTPAWSTDLKKLDARQTEAAIDVYNKAVRDDTILRAQISDKITRALIDDRVKEYQSKLNAARQRKIELGK